MWYIHLLHNYHFQSTINIWSWKKVYQWNIKICIMGGFSKHWRKRAAYFLCLAFRSFWRQCLERNFVQSGQKYRLSNDMFKFKEALVRTENRIERKRHVLHKNICPFTVLCGPCPAPVFNRIQNTELGNNNGNTQRRKMLFFVVHTFTSASVCGMLHLISDLRLS